MKVIIGLGNPGSDYDDTRHNVGWWVLDRLAFDWEFPTFERRRPCLVSEGAVGERAVRLVKPTTFMNRSGLALRALRDLERFDPAQDLLVVVDDAALGVGRLRFRPSGGPGGHNGLKSIAGALRSNQYARLRVGIGPAPSDVDITDWVLGPFEAEDEEVVVGLLPEITRAVEAWLGDGTEAAMNRFNR